MRGRKVGCSIDWWLILPPIENFLRFWGWEKNGGGSAKVFYEKNVSNRAHWNRPAKSEGRALRATPSNQNPKSQTVFICFVGNCGRFLQFGCVEIEKKRNCKCFAYWKSWKWEKLSYQKGNDLSWFWRYSQNYCESNHFHNF